MCHCTGALRGLPALEAILRGIISGLSGIKSRRMSSHEDVFYQHLLSCGGPLVCKFVSLVLLGPAVQTVRTHLSALVSFKLGNLTGNLAQVCR